MLMCLAYNFSLDLQHLQSQKQWINHKKRLSVLAPSRITFVQKHRSSHQSKLIAGIEESAFQVMQSTDWLAPLAMLIQWNLLKFSHNSEKNTDIITLQIVTESASLFQTALAHSKITFVWETRSFSRLTRYHFHHSSRLTCMQSCQQKKANSTVTVGLKLVSDLLFRGADRVIK